MAIAACLISYGQTVRFLPMAGVGQYLDENDEEEGSWGPLRAPWLIVPDFHVRGPKGFGLEPWLLDDLIQLLKWRLSKHYPTIVYAARHSSRPRRDSYRGLEVPS